ncbi:phosphate transport system regulatory protein PhoU [Halobacteriovorax marinus]|uniref:Phosphate-specific transport system accessory protein PhoU n=1 Tax=Halobacteriovorax marinus (strain ATCC BAA-682 / DSM 15412 / SJ) TaxID=862908 RepID=E1X4V8_HALMS|nr:phosphate signaling complex protein PhoU [Halobacteriovorax marinus]ATH08490.1 phosphate transport system regulatory protein PhoU [Halobacteriovorax marinus]CBW27184.1 phosphate transport system protein [Halobacteriovorax marinus SJ]
MEISSADLREMILKMATSVESIVENSAKENVSLQDIFQNENEVNKFHTDIDDHVFKYIALKTPAATDLRIALSVMKINSELERIADQAVNIKRSMNKLSKPYKQLASLSDEVKAMLKNSIDAFVKLDSKLATDVIQHDQEVNDLYREIMRDFIKRMKADSVDFDEGFAVIRVAKCLERIGDQTTNIAEDVIFLESGADIRHNADVKFGRRKEDKILLKGQQEDK